MADRKLNRYAVKFAVVFPLERGLRHKSPENKNKSLFSMTTKQSKRPAKGCGFLSFCRSAKRCARTTARVREGIPLLSFGTQTRTNAALEFVPVP